MKSIRGRITLLNIIAIVVAILATTLISAISISRLGHDSSEQALSLLCETGKNNVDYYFKSVEQSVNTVSNLVDENLNQIDESEYNTKFAAHMAQARTMFNEASANTNGVFTYYYRVDPSITAKTSTEEKGFWYVKNNKGEFEEHEVTDLTDDQFECRWFYEPKKSGKALWLPPYLTDNLDIYVLSYNVPVYNKTEFVGVIGMEINYATVGQQISNIKIDKSGFAFIIDSKTAQIIYHPKYDILSMPESERPAIPEDFLKAFKNNKHHIEYKFDGVSKHAYWVNLANEMSIVVAVPSSEVNDTWILTVLLVIITGLVIVGLFVLITVISTGKIVGPLKELTVMARKIDAGDYSVKSEYKRDDEIGGLTKTVNSLVEHLNDYISDLNALAYGDSLTSVNSKNAFDLAMRDLEEKVLSRVDLNFAIAILDCDNLKTINDRYGHDKGNVYLKNSSNLICRVFEHSEVYRLGGDEFAVILMDKDFQNRKRLKREFLAKSSQITAFAKDEWEEIHVSIGIADFDPSVDKTAQDVLIHADHIMYENKRERKASQKKFDN